MKYPFFISSNDANKAVVRMLMVCMYVLAMRICIIHVDRLLLNGIALSFDGVTILEKFKIEIIYKGNMMHQTAGMY